MAIVILTPPQVPALLTSLVRLKQELGINPADNSQNAALTANIAGVSSAIATWCNRGFAQQTVRETARQNAVPALLLKFLPVTSIASIVGPGSTTPLVASTDYELDPDVGMLIRLSGDEQIAWAGGLTTVEYTAGYVLPGVNPAADPLRTLPWDIETACVMAASSIQAGVGRDRLLRSDATQNVGSSSWLDPRAEDGGLGPMAAALLAPYRLWNM